MPQPTQPVPPGFHTLTPHLVVRDAERAIEFYKRAFGAELVGGVARTPESDAMSKDLKKRGFNFEL